MYAENLTQTHADSKIFSSVSVSAHEPTLFDFVGHDLLLSLTTKDPTIFLPLLCGSFSELHLMFGCGSLQLLTLASA